MKSGRLTPFSAIFYVLTLYYMLRGDMFALQFSGLLKILLVVTVVFMPFMKKVKA